jgi:TRAP-type C4-dicarboxylate transport system permease small subunit
MNAKAIRNVAIIAAVAAIVAFVASGDESVSFVGQVLGIAFAILFGFAGLRLYQMFRGEIYGLGDLWRGILYGSIGLVVFALAARRELVDTGAGTLGFIAMLAVSGTGLYLVWQRYRAYRV